MQALVCIRFLKHDNAFSMVFTLKNNIKCSLLSLLLAMVAMLPLHAQSVSFQLGTITDVTPGTIIDIPVTVSGFTQMLAWQGSVHWDKSKLSNITVENIHPSLSGLQSQVSVMGGLGRLSILWVEASLQPVTLANETVLFRIRAKVSQGVYGNTPFVFAALPTALLLSNALGQAVSDVTYLNGSVGFSGEAFPVTFIAGNANAIANTSFLIPVTVRNFGAITGLQASFNWDIRQVTFNGIENNSALPGLDIQSSVVGNSGRLGWVWASPNAAPVNLADETVLFNIRFTPVANANGFAAILFGDAPVPKLVTDGVGLPLNDAVYTAGSVMLPGSTALPVLYMDTTLQVYRDSVTVKVRGSSLPLLAGMQGTIAWDSSYLEWLRMDNLHPSLAGLQSNLSFKQDSALLRWIWSDVNLQSVTLSNDAVLFEMRFQVKRKEGETRLVFSNQPNPLFLINNQLNKISNVQHRPGLLSFTSRLCPLGNTTFTSSISGISYQWEMKETGGSYAAVSNDVHHEGVTSRQLVLKDVPISWINRTYRCVVNGRVVEAFEVHFRDVWRSATGTLDNPARWGCDVIPSGYTDIEVLSGVMTIDANTSVRSIFAGPGSEVRVLPGVVLIFQ